MERLTTNDPQDNIEAALNLFYAKDADVWVRGGGASPDYADITLYDFIRQIVKSLGPMSIDASVSDEELGEELYELLFDGTDTIDGLVATLYTAAWAFAELRNRLAAYEDTGLSPEEIKCLQAKWISVEERLPDNEEPVFTWASSYGDLDVLCRLDFEPFGVTHWMPLPEPPEEDE